MKAIYFLAQQTSLCVFVTYGPERRKHIGIRAIGSFDELVNAVRNNIMHIEGSISET